MTTVATSVRQVRGAVATVSDQLRIRLDPLRLFLFVLTIVNVSRIHQHYRVLARLRPAMLLVLLTAVYAFLNPKKLNTDGLFKTWPAKVVTLIAVMACLSAPFGVSLGGSASFILDSFSKVIIFSLLLIVAIRGVQDLYTFIWGYVIASGILVWMCLFLFGMSHSAGSYAVRLSDLYTYDANDVGLVLLIGLALALLTYQCSGALGKLASAVIICGVGAAIARSGSRGAFVALGVTALALLVLLRTVPVVKRLAVLGATVIALMVAAPPGYWEQMGTLTNPTQDYNWNLRDGRKEVAKRGIGYMLEYPIFGLGVNNFWRGECILSDKAANHVAGTGIRCTPPHNSYVQAGAELGLPGLVVWVGLVWGGIIGMLRLRGRIPNAWAKGDPEQRFLYFGTMYLALAIISFSISSFFLTFAWSDPVYFLAALMTGMYVCVERKLRESAGGIPSPIAVVAPRQDSRLSRRRGAPVTPAFLTPPE